jgi:hypothetical protein
MTNGSYTDWKLGATKDLGGWVIGASYVDTNSKGNCNAAPTDPQPYCFSNGSVNTANTSGFDKVKDAGKGILILSVSKTF